MRLPCERWLCLVLWNYGAEKTSLYLDASHNHAKHMPGAMKTYVYLWSDVLTAADLT